MLAKAKTGTGKTLAFLLPTVERILRARRGKTPGAARLLAQPPPLRL